jgi:glycosyltransferase 2 family protein
MLLASAKRRLFVAAQWLLAVAIVWFALRALRGQWSAATLRLQSLEPQWSWIIAATVIVLATYLLLIETWRRTVTGSGQKLTFPEASRIWFVSNLGKYVPGKIWSIAAMTMMARDSSVSGSVAAGSSVMVQLVTILAGIGVVLVTGAQAVAHPAIAVAAAAAIVLTLGLAPRFLPVAGRIAASLTGKTFDFPRMRPSLVWMAIVNSIIAWIAYGIAFQLFVRGIIGSSAGATSSYIAVYAASYIIGFLALFAPGGAVVRESAIVTGMVRFALSGQADALAIAVTSRLWLTVTELVPGLTYMAIGKRTRKLND